MPSLPDPRLSLCERAQRCLPALVAAVWLAFYLT